MGTEVQPVCVDPFAEKFESEEVVTDQHASVSDRQVNSLAEGIRTFAAMLTAEECARVPQLQREKARQAMQN